jgi:hypothetical protein
MKPRRSLVCSLMTAGVLMALAAAAAPLSSQSPLTITVYLNPT